MTRCGLVGLHCATLLGAALLQIFWRAFGGHSDGWKCDGARGGVPAHANALGVTCRLCMSFRCLLAQCVLSQARNDGYFLRFAMRRSAHVHSHSPVETFEMGYSVSAAKDTIPSVQIDAEVLL